MKISPHDRRIVERMAAGVLCRDGFLGEDGRPLGEILDTDRSAMEALGLTHERLADRLGEVLAAAMPACGAPVAVGEHLTAVYRESMGRIPCPWADGVFAKGEVVLTDARGGERVRFTPLSVHLIRAHGFYQGRGSRYRVEPAALARMLDVV